MKYVVYKNGSLITVLRLNRKSCTAYNYRDCKLSTKFVFKPSEFDYILYNHVVNFGCIVIKSNFNYSSILIDYLNSHNI